MRCGVCGSEHTLLDPAFKRPDVIAAIPRSDREARVFERDDLCALRGQGGEGNRYFVRATLAVPLIDGGPELSTRWGLWAEVSGPDVRVIHDRWTDPAQAEQEPFAGTIANQIPGYLTTTVGVPVHVQLTGPTTRPALSFLDDSAHPFASECRAGVTVHRVEEWLRRMRGEA